MSRQRSPEPAAHIQTAARHTTTQAAPAPRTDPEHATPYDVLRLQRLAGNGAVQHMLAPRPPGPGTPPVVQRQDRQDPQERPPSLEDVLGGWEPLPVLPPPIPTTTIILVGAPAKPGFGLDNSPYNFSNAAVEVVPKVREFNADTPITILFFTPGYKSRGVEEGRNVYEKARADLQGTGAAVVEVSTAAQVINLLNTGLVTPADNAPTRAVKVSRFFYFGHGSSHRFSLNIGWGNEQSVTRDDITKIKTDAFNPQGKSYLFTCNVAQGEQSFMSVWASHLGQAVAIGAGKKTAFNAEYTAKNLDDAVNQELPSWFLGLPYMNEVKIIDTDEEEPQP